MPERNTYPSAAFGLLQSIPPHCYGFINGLPAYQGNIVIEVVVDRFSKAAHFGGLHINFLACKPADLFTNIILNCTVTPKALFRT